MAHYPKPWYRAARGVWYVEIDGQQHNLGPDETEAFCRYHALMAQPPGQRITTDSVVALIDAYLDWCHKNRAPKTYAWYLDRLQAFCESLPRGLTVQELKPYHLQRWIDRHDGWSNGNKRNACRAVQRAMRWSEQQGYIERSPLVHFQKPPAGRREQIVTEDEYKTILATIRDENLRDVVTVAWETGARPQESLRVEARHVDLDHARWVIPASESKMGRLPRVVYLTDIALDITKRAMTHYPRGPIFRTARGKPWTANAVNCRFEYLKKKLGKRYCLYALRHTWATRALQKGVDPLTVSQLMGHVDTNTLARTYAHLSHDPAYLRSAVSRATT